MVERMNKNISNNFFSNFSFFLCLNHWISFLNLKFLFSLSKIRIYFVRSYSNQYLPDQMTMVLHRMCMYFDFRIYFSVCLLRPKIDKKLISEKIVWLTL